MRAGLTSPEGHLGLSNRGRSTPGSPQADALTRDHYRLIV
jgi:hypothetical protein